MLTDALFRSLLIDIASSQYVSPIDNVQSNIDPFARFGPLYLEVLMRFFRLSLRRLQMLINTQSRETDSEKSLVQLSQGYALPLSDTSIKEVGAHVPLLERWRGQREQTSSTEVGPSETTCITAVDVVSIEFRALYDDYCRSTTWVCSRGVFMFATSTPLYSSDYIN